MRRLAHRHAQFFFHRHFDVLNDLGEVLVLTRSQGSEHLVFSGKAGLGSVAGSIVILTRNVRASFEFVSIPVFFSDRVPTIHRHV